MRQRAIVFSSFVSSELYYALDTDAFSQSGAVCAIPAYSSREGLVECIARLLVSGMCFEDLPDIVEIASRPFHGQTGECSSLGRQGGRVVIAPFSASAVRVLSPCEREDVRRESVWASRVLCERIERPNAQTRQAMSACRKGRVVRCQTVGELLRYLDDGGLG